MSEMVERVRKAIRDEISRDPDVWLHFASYFRIIEGHMRLSETLPPEALARAVIAAAREPTEAMINRVFDPGDTDGSGRVTRMNAICIWEEMIDEALGVPDSD